MKVSRPSIWPVAFYTALAGGAFALRMYNIGQQPVWTDEVTTIEPIRRLAFWEFARIQAQIDPNPPLYHLLAYGWGRLGDSVEWIRALSAVFGALTVPALYRLAREGLGRWASLLAALFVCFTPLHIHLSLIHI